MNSSRRNGKPASCEPCRKNKTRCDHNYPKCDRCHQRGIADQCFYHPAPLTKRRETLNGEGQPIGAPNEARPRKRRRAANHSTETEEGVLPTPTLSQDDNFADAVAAQSLRPGYLGPTSFAAIFPTDDGSGLPREGFDEEASYQHPLTKAIRMQMAGDILRSLRHYKAILPLVRGYCVSCHAGYVAETMEINAVEALQKTVDKFDLIHKPPDCGLVSLVLENTSRALDISPDLQAQDFHKICTGESLRLEVLGWLFATAGRSWLFGLGTSAFKDEKQPPMWRDQFLHDMLRASTTCLVLCTLLSPANDLMIWLFYENLLFTIMMCGYSGPPTWRRLGELATQIYALGVHKESNSSNLPIFILETRRKVFCAAYNLDKTISTFLGRPLRLSKRHTDIRLPLDLTDFELTADRQNLERFCQALDNEGWNKKGQYNRTSWIRLRFISARFREEILDLALAKLDECVEQQLLDISRRNRESWDSLPQHLRYWPGCWDKDIPSGVCLMLVVVYLTHFYNEFMIQKLLDHQPLTSNQALLRVSLDLLTTALTLGSIRDRTYDVMRDFLHTILLFGVPTASVLATALQEQHQTGAHFPPTISRSEIIRTLSVLISHLDNAAHLDSGTRMGDGNFNLCRKAAKTFTKVIDAVLDPQPSVNVETIGEDKRGETEQNISISEELDAGLDLLDFFGAPGLEVFNGMDVMAGSLYDGVDWNAVGQWTL